MNLVVPRRQLALWSINESRIRLIVGASVSLLTTVFKIEYTLFIFSCTVLLMV